MVDLTARLIGQRLSREWGQTVIIENKPGGSFQIAASYVAKAAPDGYTLFLAMDAPFIINPHLYDQLSYDPVKDFAPITGLVSLKVALVAHPSLPVNNVRDLIELAKKKPGELNYGSFGVGSTANLYMAMLSSEAKIKMTPVHYKGVAPMINDVVAGHVPLMFLSVGQAIPLVGAGKVKVFGVASAVRLEQFPHARTIAESGVPGFEAKQWFGLFAPSGTPREIVDKINAEVRRIFADTSFVRPFSTNMSRELMVGSPEELALLIRSEREIWGKVIRDANLKGD